jgi:hypothetical protein
LEIGTSSIDWAVTKYDPPEEGGRIQPPKCCVLNKNRMMDNVQKHNNYINTIPLSQTFGAYYLFGGFLLGLLLDPEDKGNMVS